MEEWSSGYQKSEIVSIAEQLHKLKSEKAAMELELSEQKFRYRYIPQRRQIASSQFRNLLILVFPLTVIILFFLVIIIWMMAQEGREMLHSGIGGVAMLVGLMVIVFGGYADFKLIKQAAVLQKLLAVSRNEGNASAESIQKDSLDTKEKIDVLTRAIAECERKMKEKQQRQEELLKEKEAQENILREKGILFDELPDADKKKSTFTLKKESDVDAEAAAQLYEFYKHEEQYIINFMLQLEGRLEHLNKEVVDIEENFENVKRKLLYSGVVFLLVVLVQNQFTGILQSLTSLFCLFLSVSYIFYLDRACKKPVLDYLIEHDSALTKEYAFCTDAVPVAEKRREVTEQIEHCRKELSDLRDQREKIKFS